MSNIFSRILFQSALYLLMVSLLVGADLRWASAQAVSPLEPPKWSVGDWWTVECQVYDSGKTVKGPVPPGWRPKQVWRFQVEGIENIEDQPYFMVSIKPQGDNKCPYWFRYWFRESDRHIGRQELHHPSATAGKKGNIGPPVVRKEFSPASAGPFFGDQFPSLPLTMPLFRGDQPFMPFSSRRGKFDIHQEVGGVSAMKFMGGSEAPLLKEDAPLTPDANRMVKITATSNNVEQQVWNPAHPWCVYGERVQNDKPFRRYWLAEYGKN